MACNVNLPRGKNIENKLKYLVVLSIVNFCEFEHFKAYTSVRASWASACTLDDLTSRHQTQHAPLIATVDDIIPIAAGVSLTTLWSLPISLWNASTATCMKLSTISDQFVNGEHDWLYLIIIMTENTRTVVHVS